MTFDHFVPADDTDPDVLQINVFEFEDDNGAYANENLPFAVDPAAFMEKKLLAVPRCCQKRKGTQGGGRVNEGVAAREKRLVAHKNLAALIVLSRLIYFLVRMYYQEVKSKQ